MSRIARCSVKLRSPNSAGAELPSMMGAVNVPACTPPSARGSAMGNMASLLHVCAPRPTPPTRSGVDLGLVETSAPSPWRACLASSTQPLPTKFPYEPGSTNSPSSPLALRTVAWYACPSSAACSSLGKSGTGHHGKAECWPSVGCSKLLHI